jgi:predicted membrane protein
VSSLDTPRERHGAVDVVASLLAAFSITLSALALVERPARLAPVAAILALVAGRMSARWSKLAMAAMIIATVAWVVGMTIAVITDGELL